MKTRILFAAMAMLASNYAHACLQQPIPGTLITSNFGMRFHPVYKTWKSHNGTDMRAAMFTPVKAAHSGQVTFSGFMGGGGNVVIILGSDGVQTRYLHLAKAGVPSGSYVSAGQLIAQSGNTGHASAAPHLHFEARMNGGSTPVDSRSLLCQALAEKSGAGPDSSGNGQQAPRGPVGADGTPTNFDSEPNFNGWADMSELDIMRNEVEKRFLNPDWHVIMNGCGADINMTAIDGVVRPAMACDAFLRKEMLIMTSLKNYLKFKTKESRERSTAILGARLVDQVKADRSELDALRQRAQGSEAVPR
ncbi:M23 family metallopeptidase [Methylobacillus sp. Pita2]|uniref:M23 family metallopeptidase n=1 Tax=Methylobacillus sp. Pita2 TaxID=3383245 RepID=UPI0038B4ACF3